MNKKLLSVVAFPLLLTSCYIEKPSPSSSEPLPERKFEVEIIGVNQDSLKKDSKFVYIDFLVTGDIDLLAPPKLQNVGTGENLPSDCVFLHNPNENVSDFDYLNEKVKLQIGIEKFTDVAQEYKIIEFGATSSEPRTEIYADVSNLPTLMVDPEELYSISNVEMSKNKDVISFDIDALYDIYDGSDSTPPTNDLLKIVDVECSVTRGLDSTKVETETLSATKIDTDSFSIDLKKLSNYTGYNSEDNKFTYIGDYDGYTKLSVDKILTRNCYVDDVYPLVPSDNVKEFSDVIDPTKTVSTVSQTTGNVLEDYVYSDDDVILSLDVTKSSKCSVKSIVIDDKASYDVVDRTDSDDAGNYKFNLRSLYDNSGVVNQKDDVERKYTITGLIMNDGIEKKCSLPIKTKFLGDGVDHVDGSDRLTRNQDGATYFTASIKFDGMTSSDFGFEIRNDNGSVNHDWQYEMNANNEMVMVNKTLLSSKNYTFPNVILKYKDKDVRVFNGYSAEYSTFEQEIVTDADISIVDVGGVKKIYTKLLNASGNPVTWVDKSFQLICKIYDGNNVLSERALTADNVSSQIEDGEDCYILKTTATKFDIEISYNTGNTEFVKKYSFGTEFSNCTMTKEKYDVNGSIRNGDYCLKIVSNVSFDVFLPFSFTDNNGDYCYDDQDSGNTSISLEGKKANGDTFTITLARYFISSEKNALYIDLKESGITEESDLVSVTLKSIDYRNGTGTTNPDIEFNV